MEILIFLSVLLLIVTLVGHGIWVSFAWFVRQISSSPSDRPQVQSLGLSRCQNCNFELSPSAVICGHCGWRRPSGIVVELLKDLAATGRQIERFHRFSVITDDTYEKLKSDIEAEKLSLLARDGPSPASASPPVSRPTTLAEQTSASLTEPLEEKTATVSEPPPSVVTASLVATEDKIIIEPAPASFLSAKEQPFTEAHRESSSAESTRYVPPPRSPRRPLSEVLNAFMEESNIRWGEIVGGLLIVGCSTALVVSLWSEISQIPVLKFLIFTTVTAALFGIGLYTEHRWKLPTTSRGILTIAALLVPLNFLAIAAVSGGAESPGALVIGSELVAPAVFLCLVYFSGKVLTPSWPHLLAAGVLGSSIGQLLIRHFASPDMPPSLLLALGAFPLACYVGSAMWMLRKALAESVIDESETTAVFITLGAITFAAALPFGLLLYKTGPVGMTMMYLAPLVSLAGFPMLATGTLLWRRITSKDLAASRTAGTSMAILGTLTVLSGMILAWPNPASIVPAALFNFAVFTTLAVMLEIPAAQLLAAFCFGLAYLVLFQVIAGHVAWQNLRITSLLDVSVSVSSGQALSGLFALFLGAAEWLARKGRAADSKFYLIGACGVGVISVLLVSIFNFGLPGDPYGVWLICALYAAGAVWIAWRHHQIAFTWIGSGLLLLSLSHALGPWLGIPFPWQTAMLAHASVCAVAAILSRRFEGDAQGILTRPLNQSALAASFVGVFCLLQAGRWETTAMQAERVFWLASIWLVLLWLNRHRDLFTAFQMALTCAVVLAIKATLQQYDWYVYLPHAFLHPWGLQIQGTALILLSLAWIAVRLAIKRMTPPPSAGSSREESPNESSREVKNANWATPAWRLLDSQWSFDRFTAWFVLMGFLLLAIYGALSGLRQELTGQGTDTTVWNIAGFPHQQALGLGSWILLAFLIVTMLANLCERRSAVYFLGAVAALIAVCPLLAGMWETQIATASAWRWLAALLLLLASAPLWFREPVFDRLKSFGWPEIDINRNALSRRTRILLLAATLAPLLVLTAYPALRAIYYLPVHGPAAGFFALLDDEFSYSVPLVLAALALIGYAVRERLPIYAFVAGLFFNVTVTMAYLLSVVAVSGSMNRVVFANAIQLNAITSAVYALVWLSARERWPGAFSEVQATTAEALFRVQVGIAIAANALQLAPVAVRLVLRPDLAGIGTMEAGRLRGWVAVFLTVMAAAWFGKAYRKRLTAGAVCAFLIAVSCLTAFTAARWEMGNWAGFHTLMAALAVTAWLLCVARLAPGRLEAVKVSEQFSRDKSWFAEDWEWNTSLFATIIGAVTVLFALRAPFADPSGSSWSVATLVGMSALAAALNWQTLKRGYLYAAGLLFSTAAFIWWLAEFANRFPGGARILEVHVIALCASSIVWLALELRARRLATTSTSTALSFHNLAALWSLLIMGCFELVLLAVAASGVSAPGVPSITEWLALVSLAGLLVACLWDRHAKYSVAALYLVGLLLAGMVLDYLHLPPRRLAWSAMIVMAIYTVAASLFWRSREKIITWAERLKIPRRIESSVTQLKWLTFFNAALVAIVVLLAYWIDLGFIDWSLRITAALAVAGQALAFGLMAEGMLRARWQRAAIALLILGLVFFGWAWLVPGITGTWLNRAVILMVEMFALTALYGLGLSKALEREPDWTKAAQTCIPWIAGTGIVALLFALSTEVFYQINFGSVRIRLLSLIVIGLTLVGGIVICVLFALSPKHDPLSLSERGRMKYVYVAEVMLALVFMHIRLTMPWLFSGFFERYWPFVVMAIAYLGVATSESLRRRKLLVLAQPIERTGAFLPLLPVLGFWLAQSKVDYSALLFVVGGLYGLLSILRRSFGFGLVAAIAGNGGLWYLLHRTENYRFFDHPQLWLIPVALSVLLAGYLNEDDFSEEQMAGLRYLSLATIYASSTADIFINGVADSPWLPLVLAALSLAGVFCGIIFRIRGLLLLGSVFLLLAIITMIWYASVNLGWTWLWYVAGIVTGATIIFMFALFEKKRGEVLRVVEGLKDWDR